jgi:hypothetical protein
MLGVCGMLQALAHVVPRLIQLLPVPI